ncbi:MAG: hypothetical protein JST93_15500 [Acidobacteria bacterium]|nr:hypothetical protein [Acidobacteriota bacterium]
MPDPTPEQILEHVEKIATSEMFLQSGRLCRFLRFTVEAKLRGNAEQIKEYLLGREVFDRNGDYDPRTDPIVRVEARRLRKKLDEYYAGPGAQDTLRIGYPKGSYTPEFTTTPPASKPVRRRTLYIAAAAILTAASLFLLAPFRNPQTIAVIPARWVWQDESFPASAIDIDLAERIAAELANQHKLAVIAWPSMDRFRQGKWTAKQIAATVGAARTLVVAVREDAAGLRITAYLLDAHTDRKLRIADEPSLPLATATERSDAARVIARAIAVQ